ncbi:hypothetical protein BJV77DRAFT_966309 [Russula vinacea]|nr:hypothetical protein BJV77DRAFT_966309 [Russula vinacea]
MYTYVYKGVNWDTGGETIASKVGKDRMRLRSDTPATYVHEVLVELQEPYVVIFLPSKSPRSRGDEGACKGVFYLIAVGGEHLLDAVGKGAVMWEMRSWWPGTRSLAVLARSPNASVGERGNGGMFSWFSRRASSAGGNGVRGVVTVAVAWTGRGTTVPQYWGCGGRPGCVYSWKETRWGRRTSVRCFDCGGAADFRGRGISRSGGYGGGRVTTRWEGRRGVTPDSEAYDRRGTPAHLRPVVAGVSEGTASAKFRNVNEVERGGAVRLMLSEDRESEGGRCDCEVNKDGPSVDQDDKEVYAKEQQCGPTPTAKQVTLARRAP